MWIVVEVKRFYPSVTHYKTFEEAKKYFDSFREDKPEAIVHLAKVEETIFNEDEDGIPVSSNFDKNKVETWDVEW